MIPHDTPDLKAQEVRTAVAAKWQGEPLSSIRDGQTLLLDAAPALITNKRGDVVGVDAMVRLIDAKGREVPIDPHRIIVNPPLQVVDADATYDAKGEELTPRVLRQDPEAAYWDVVWASVLNVPNAPGWRTKGTVTTVFANTNDGEVYSQDTVFGTPGAQNGSNLAVNTSSTTYRVGQTGFGAGPYDVWEGFFSFDTSSIGSDTVTAVTLSLDGNANHSTVDFTAQARAYDWGTSLTTADWRNVSQLGALTLLATWASSGYSANYNAFTESGSNFRSAINGSGDTRILVCSSRHVSGSDPGGNDEYVTFTSANASGTTTDPKIDVTHLSPIVSTPGVLSLSTTRFAPVIHLDKIATPGVKNLSITGLAPTVIAPQLSVPGVASLSLTTYAPTVTVGTLVTPGPASLVLDGLAPAISTPRLVTPDLLTLNTTSYAPTVLAPRLVTVGLTALTITAYNPSALTPQTFTPDTLALITTLYAPNPFLIARAFQVHLAHFADTIRLMSYYKPVFVGLAHYHDSITLFAGYALAEVGLANSGDSGNDNGAGVNQHLEASI